MTAKKNEAKEQVTNPEEQTVEEQTVEQRQASLQECNALQQKYWRGSGKQKEAS